MVASRLRLAMQAGPVGAAHARVPKMRLGVMSGSVRMGSSRLLRRAPSVMAAVMPPMKASVRLPKVRLPSRTGRAESGSWKSMARSGVARMTGSPLVSQ